MATSKLDCNAHESVFSFARNTQGEELYATERAPKKKYPAFGQEDMQLLEEVAGYASLVMGSLERGRHKEDHLVYTQRLTALWHAFRKVCKSPAIIWPSCMMIPCLWCTRAALSCCCLSPVCCGLVPANKICGLWQVCI